MILLGVFAFDKVFKRLTHCCGTKQAQKCSGLNRFTFQLRINEYCVNEFYTVI